MKKNIVIVKDTLLENFTKKINDLLDQDYECVGDIKINMYGMNNSMIVYHQVLRK